MKENITKVFEIDDIIDRIEKNLQFLRDSLEYVEKYSSKKAIDRFKLAIKSLEEIRDEFKEK